MRIYRYTFLVLGAIVTIAAIATGWIAFRASHSDERSDSVTWVWDLNRLLGGDTAKVDSAVSFLKEHQVVAVYLYASGSIAEPADLPLYRSFIEAARGQNIEVHALGGEREWALKEQSPGLAAFLQRVADYNDSVPAEARFAGVHLDVEPYSLPEWHSDQSDIIGNWKSVVSAAREFAWAHSLALGVDLPFWLDGVPAGPDGDSAKTLDAWMMANSDSVALMSYRTEAEGDNGVLALVRQEMEHAADSSCRIYIGLNAAADTDAKLTFKDKGIASFNRVSSQIRRAYSKAPAFGGIAVHDLDAWMALEQDKS